MKQIESQEGFTFHVVMGLVLLAIIMCGVFALVFHAQNPTSIKSDTTLLSKNPARQDRTPASSHHTGEIFITFVQGTTYQQATTIFEKLHVTNVKSDFLSPNIVVDFNEDRASPEGSNKLYKLRAALYAAPEFQSMQNYDLEGHEINLFFKVGVSEARIRQILTDNELVITKGAKFNLNYQAKIKVPKGEEPEYIKKLYNEHVVEQANEAITTIN